MSSLEAGESGMAVVRLRVTAPGRYRVETLLHSRVGETLSIARFSAGASGSRARNGADGDGSSGGGQRGGGPIAAVGAGVVAAAVTVVAARRRRRAG